MIKNTQRQTGSAHVIVIVILVLLIVSVLGYVAWNKFFKPSELTKNDSNSISQDEPQKAKSEIIVLPNSDMNKYVNYENNFEFLFPKETLAPDKCKVLNEKFDRYGNMIPSEAHYVASDGAVPMTVLQKSDEYIITTTRVVAQLNPVGSKEKGYIYTSCEVQPVTLDLIDDYSKDNYGIKNAAINKRSFVVKNASNESVANDAAKNIFNDLKGETVWTQDPNEEDRLIGVFKYDTTVDRTGGFAYRLWFYPAQKKVVFFALGQSVFFQYPDGSNQYYNPADSFKFTK